MNKKQAFIIATLLVLIVCAGILATKVNSPLYVDSSEITQKADASVGKNSATNFFTEQKLNREQDYAKTVPTYQTLIDDPDTTKEAKEAAVEKLKEFTTTNENEKKVEAALVGKGYEETYCQVMGDKVNVYVKVDDNKLTEKQTRDIQNVVLGITKIKDVEIAPKQ